MVNLVASPAYLQPQRPPNCATVPLFDDSLANINFSLGFKSRIASVRCQFRWLIAVS
jgi:hypothetical protein